jgi:hypothetical protein
MSVLCTLLKIIRSSSCNTVKEDLFGNATTKSYLNLIFKLLSSIESDLIR